MHRPYWRWALVSMLLLFPASCASRPPDPVPPVRGGQSTGGVGVGTGGILSGRSTPAAAGGTLESGALAMMAEGRVADARALAEQQVKAQPDSSDAHLQLSEVEFAAGDYDKALREARRAAELAGDRTEQMRSRFTLLRVQMFADPLGALATARQQAGDRRAPDVILLAEAMLLEAAVRGQKQPAPREARALLEGVRAEALASRQAGDFQAVLANSYLLEGDLPNARKAYEGCLRHDLGMADRVTDVLNALAWIAFLQGDDAAAGRYLDRALAKLGEGLASDGFGLLPKVESYALLRLALTGSATRGEFLAKTRAHQEKLLRQGFQDLDAFRENRQVGRALLDAWERKDFGQAWFCLARRAQPQPAEEIEAPIRVLAAGPDRLQPRCFYRETVEKQQHQALPRLLLARMAERAGKPALAATWYRKALELVPGNPVVDRRLRALGKAGQADPRAEAPGPDETIRVMFRLAQQGWTDALVPGLDYVVTRGATLADFQRMAEDGAPRYRHLVDSLEGAVAALDRGSTFRRGPVPPAPPGSTDYDDPAWWAEERAVLQPLTMHLEEGVWMLTSLGEAPPGPSGVGPE